MRPDDTPQPVEVFSHVGELALQPVTGDKVALPAAAVARVYRLAWFTTASVHPELRLEGPGVADLAKHFAGVALPAVEAGALLIRFPGGAGFSTLNKVGKVGAEPWSHVPAGTTLELATRPLEGGDETLGGPGFSRFRGTIDVVGGECIWTIRETFPRVSADVLRRALALSAAAESDDRLTLADEKEAKRVYEAFKARWAYKVYPWMKLTLTGAELRLAPGDTSVIHYVALAGFRAMFESVWPHDPEPEDEDLDGD